jgi:hypothetical protein
VKAITGKGLLGKPVDQLGQTPKTEEELLFEYISILYSLERFGGEPKNWNRLYETVEMQIKAKILSLYMSALGDNNHSLVKNKDEEVNILTELSKDDIEYIFQRMAFETKAMANVLEM